ncbi:DUF3616 domain-containing protein [Pseudomonas putida]|nr:DUF3616 domain-containing protein [Pseudomonas putida]
MGEKWGTVLFTFKTPSLCDGLSAVERTGDSLWLANDETTSLERLQIGKATDTGTIACNEHRVFPLREFLNLPVKQDDTEIDIEGLAYDAHEGYLWLTGSHSLKRKKADADKPAHKNIKRLATVEADGNRYLLARIPVVVEDDRHALADKVDSDGRSAAQLRGDDTGNELTAAIAEDEHLRDFLRIPGKDNGFDIEGLAVNGPRLLLGLRGPVLRGWAVVLEIEPEQDKNSPGTLRLKPIGPDGRPYRKHFFDLEGLGVRDLCWQGDDLLVLAGPTLDLDGPVTVFRWRGALASDEESVVFPDQLEKVLEVPFGKGDDHAEGLCLYEPGDGTGAVLLVVYDAAAEQRKQGATGVEGDLFVIN